MLLLQSHQPASVTLVCLAVKVAAAAAIVGSLLMQLLSSLSVLMLTSKGPHTQRTPVVWCVCSALHWLACFFTLTFPQGGMFAKILRACQD